jgi:hypothetical protein
MICNGEVHDFLIIDNYEWDDDPYYDENEEPKQYPPDFCLGIAFNRASTFPEKAKEIFVFPNQINFSLSQRLFDQSLPLEVQYEFIELFKKTIASINGVTGFITYESLGAGLDMTSSYEQYYRLDPIRKPGYVESVKGYFWLNYLSNDHIDN